MNDIPPRPIRRPAAWLAVLLNLLVAPLGYAYAGALRWALGYTVFSMAFGLAMAAWSLVNPPGMFTGLEGFGPLQIFGLTLNLAAAVHAGFLSRTAERRRNLFLLIAIGLALWVTPLALSLVARFLAPIATYQTASASMSPTLEEGDLLLSNGARTFCGRARVEPGDVVISVRDGVTYSHRAVAGAGQTVAMQGGRLIIDGKPVATRPEGRRQDGTTDVDIVRETLANGRSYLTADMGDSAFDETPAVTIPAGHWFTLGDNRDNAADSRMNGPVAASTICGVVVRVLNSADAQRVGTRP